MHRFDLVSLLKTIYLRDNTPKFRILNRSFRMNNTQKTVVNSWNEWDPLRHVIVGRADDCHIPAEEPALEAKVPEDSDMRGQWPQTTGNY
jgi:hypothetical protein